MLLVRRKKKPEYLEESRPETRAQHKPLYQSGAQNKKIKFKNLKKMLKSWFEEVPESSEQEDKNLVIHTARQERRRLSSGIV